MNARHQILVLGMHRSGTSAVTAVLEACGAFIGSDEELTPASVENPKGFFERRDIRRICDSLLHSAEADWWKVRTFDIDKISPSAAIDSRQTIRRIVGLLNEKGTWALKEPRLCHLLPIFLRHLDDPVALIVARHPLEIARSLRHRNGFATIEALALWEAYTVAACRNSSSLPRTIVSYSDFIHNPGVAAEQLCAELGRLGVVGVSRANVAVPIDVALRHEAVQPEDEVLLSSFQRLLWSYLSRGIFPPEEILQVSPTALAILADFEIDYADSLERAKKTVSVEHAERLAETLRRTEQRGRRLLQIRDALGRRLQMVTTQRDLSGRQLGRLTRQASQLDARLRQADVERRRNQAEAQRQLKRAEADRTLAEKRFRESELRVRRADAQVTQSEARLRQVERRLKESEVKLGQVGIRLKAAEAERQAAQRESAAVHKSKLEIKNKFDLVRSNLVAMRTQLLALPTQQAIVRLDTTLQAHADLIARKVPLLSGALLSVLPLDRRGTKLADLVRFANQAFDVQDETLLSRFRRKDPLRRLAEDMRLVAASGLFAPNWYLKKYPEVVQSGLNPLYDFVQCGGKIGRDPGPRFSSRWYLSRYPDVAASGLNPLVHYLRHGKRERRLPRPPSDGVNQVPRAEIRVTEKGHTLSPFWRLLLGFASSGRLAANGQRRLARKALKPVKQPQAARQPVWWCDLTPSRDEQAANRHNYRASIAKTLARLEVAPPVTVIVPVWNAALEVDRCLASLVRHTPRNTHVIVIDDASPDDQVRRVMSQYIGHPGLELVSNATNLGFTRTINRGIELAGKSDVIFLNSDTEVTSSWLRRLRFAAYSDDRIATVTPLSNNAGAFSVPVLGEQNEIPTWLDLDSYSRAIAQVSLRSYPATPTGNGFCMYVRRDCIDEIGSLDASAFPKGYGEENDFCMRARRRNWKHIVDDTTFIYHVRSASFGEAKRELIKVGREIINSRYPDYTAAVREFVSSERIRAVQDRVRAVASAVVLGRTGVKPRILYVLSTTSGGTPQTNQDLMTALDDRIEAFILRCDSRTLTLTHFQGGTQKRMESHELNAPLTAFPHRSDEYDDVVAEWLVRYQFELVHIRHISWHGLGLISVAKRIGLPVVFSLHDYYAICPTVKLLDESNTYCGGHCTKTEGECKHQLWREPDFPALKNRAIHDWRSQFEPVLQLCDVFVTTSQGAKNLYLEHYPFMGSKRFDVIPHGRDFASFEECGGPFDPAGVIRLVFPGNISAAKGGKVIAGLAAVAANKRIELHILGRIEGDVDVPANVVVHGPYARENFVSKIRKIRPHIGCILSVWPETHCHTLTELWAAGLPVIGFDLGAVADRINATGGGWLISDLSREGVVSILDTLRSNPADYLAKSEAVKAWQMGAGIRENCLTMSHAYYDLYRFLLDSSVLGTSIRRPVIGIVSPNTTTRNGVVTRGPGSTHVRLAEKMHDSVRRSVRYDFISHDDAQRLAPAYDGLLIQRSALGSPPQNGSACCPLMVEIDDDLLSLSTSESQSSEYSGRGEALKKLLESASAVFASTPTLVDKVKTINSSVVLEPNAVSSFLWFAPLGDQGADASIQNLARRPDDEIRVLYAGTVTHAADLAMVKPAILQVMTKNPRFRIFTIGVTSTPEDWFESIPVPRNTANYPRFVPWLRRIMANMSFGIAPLVDNEFNRSKSDLKFLEYSAGSLACIASDVEAYRSTIRNGENGLLVSNTSEAWAQALQYAAENPDAMHRMASAARIEIISQRLTRHREAFLDETVSSALLHASSAGAQCL